MNLFSNLLSGLGNLLDPLGVTRTGGISSQKTNKTIKNEKTVTVKAPTYGGVIPYYDEKQNKVVGITPEEYKEKQAAYETKKATTATAAPKVVASATPKVDTSAYDKKIAELENKIYELEHPKVYSAKELADIYGIDYNEQNILNDYNKSTNEYYDEAVKAQNDLRTQYARNNARYVDQIADSYINSYANAAPTAVGKGSLAANALSTQLNAAQLNAANDYGMMQSVNNLEEARKAELKKNPNLAKQYYNNIGTYLSGLSAELNKSDVKQYVDQLDAYSQMYAADRSYQSYLAQANAAKYAGLANAAATNAATAANRANSFDKLWNYFYTSNGGDSNYASNAVANLLKTSNSNTGK